MGVARGPRCAKHKRCNGATNPVSEGKTNKHMDVAKDPVCATNKYRDNAQGPSCGENNKWELDPGIRVVTRSCPVCTVVAKTTTLL